MKDKLKGGMADNKSLQDIADKFNLSVYKIRKELNMGIKIEMEHVNEKSLAREISLDHLIEIPDYYTRLKKMEKEGIEYWNNIKNIKEGFQMSNIKKYDEFVNELKSSTWQSAADKADEYGQEKLSNRFRQKHNNTLKFEEEERKRLQQEKNKKDWEKRKEENIELRIMNEYKYDYYLSSYDLSEDGDVHYGDVVKMELQDMDLWSYDEFAFFLDFKTIEGDNLPGVDAYNSIMALIVIDVDTINNEHIIRFNNYGSKFANKKSTVRFLKTLKKLYIVQDYNKRAKMMAKINNTTVSEIKNGDFRRFIDKSFGSWDGFISKINIRKLYDTY